MCKANVEVTYKAVYIFPLICIATALLLLLPLMMFGQTKEQASEETLDSLLVEKHYPALEIALATQSDELAPHSRAYFQGVIANRLNQAAKSLGLLKPLIPELLVNNPTRGELALCAVADDYAKSFLYGDAARVYAEAGGIAEQQNVASSCDAGNEALRWSLFKNAPIQTVSSPNDFTVEGRWDSIGLIEIPVTAGGYTGLWILDSGANVSIISQSVASQMGVETSSGTGAAEGSAGASISVHSAIVPELRLGSAVVRNVPVLVAADSDLDFPALDYRISGSLGLPVLAALRTVTVYRDAHVQFAVNNSAEHRALPHNLFLENFTPAISANLGLGDRLFTIDTGAAGTILSSRFYRESRPLKSDERVQLQLIGAGGQFVVDAYQIPVVAAKIGGVCATIQNVQVLTEPVGTAEEFYGNLGENAFKSFDSFTLDFATMHFSVRGNGDRCGIESR
jgi:hypothetical protein